MRARIHGPYMGAAIGHAYAHTWPYMGAYMGHMGAAMGHACAHTWPYKGQPYRESREEGNSR